MKSHGKVPVVPGNIDFYYKSSRPYQIHGCTHKGKHAGIEARPRVSRKSLRSTQIEYNPVINEPGPLFVDDTNCSGS